MIDPIWLIVSLVAGYIWGYCKGFREAERQYYKFDHPYPYKRQG